MSLRSITTVSITAPKKPQTASVNRNAIIQGFGGLEEKLIDTQTSDGDCHQFLQDVFHSKVESLPKPVDDTASAHQSDTDQSDDALGYLGHACHRKFGGLCEQRTPGVDITIACKLVRIFNRALKDQLVKVGSLVSLKSTNPEPFIGFVGVCMQRPMVHVLMKVDCVGMGGVGMGDVILWHDPELPSPVFSTSHQVFQQLISQESDVVSVEVWQYALNRNGNGLQVQPLTVAKSFKLDPASKIETRKPRPKLRLSLKVPTKKQEKKKKKKKKKETGTTTRKTKRKARADDDDDANDTGLSSASTNNSTIRRKRAVSHVEESGKDKDIREESEVYFPISDAAAKEERKASDMMADQEALRDSLPATKPACPPSGQASSSKQSARAGASFFSKSCGLEDVGIAVSNRSKCYFCHANILKGDVRFCWHWNTLRPSVWVHSGCLKQLVQRDGHSEHTIQRLQEVQLRVTDPQSPIAVEVLRALSDLSPKT